MRKNIDLNQLAAVMHGTLEGNSIPYSSINTDTRTLKPSDIFLALTGASFDGHQFISEAISKGAAAVVAQKDKIKKDALISVPVIWVDNTTIALGKWAHFWRMQYDIPIIGITGSCGKTTVKSMVGSILSLLGPTLVPEGSFNNQFGVPFSLLKLNNSHKFGVFEAGTNAFGEIEYLAKILDPTHALINNVNPAHLKGLKSVDHIAQEKGQLYQNLRLAGTAIINADQPHASLWRAYLKNQRILTFGLSHSNLDVTAVDIELKERATNFILKTLRTRIAIELNVPGIHNVMNALASAAIAISLDISLEDIQKGLMQYSGVSGRLMHYQTTNGARVIDDSYNANPASFKAAIDVLSLSKGRKILVMGDMGELGTNSRNYHEEIGAYAKTQGIDALFTLGDSSLYAATQFGSDARAFKDKSTMLESLQPFLVNNTTILIKGSRSSKMEDIINALIN